MLRSRLQLRSTERSRLPVHPTRVMRPFWPPLVGRLCERWPRARARTPSPTGITLDFLVLCAGSFKAARALSRERIGSVLRQPFVESDTREGVGVTHEDPAGEGLQRALGELVTCTRCAGTWTAAGLLTCQAVAPRFGQLLTWSLAAGAGNDFLQAAFCSPHRARTSWSARDLGVDPTSRGLSSEHIARDVVRPK